MAERCKAAATGAGPYSRRRFKSHSCLTVLLAVSEFLYATSCLVKHSNLACQLTKRFATFTQQAACFTHYQCTVLSWFRWLQLAARLLDCCTCALPSSFASSAPSTSTRGAVLAACCSLAVQTHLSVLRQCLQCRSGCA